MLLTGHDALPLPLLIFALSCIAAATALLHWIYLRRNAPSVREFLDAIRPFQRNPGDEAWMAAAIIGDVIFLVGVYLLVTGRR